MKDGAVKRRWAAVLFSALSCLALAGAGWQSALPGWNYHFPADHGVHRAFKTEWWYFTGELRADSGETFGYQITFFREAIRPSGPKAADASRFIVDDVKFAHFAVTRVTSQNFTFMQKTSRGAYGEAGFGDSGKLAWIDNWTLSAENDGSFLLKAAGNGVSIDLRLEAQKPFVIHGANGVSQKANGVGHASHYYSSTRMKTRGRLAYPDGSRSVTGESWFDHEWSTNELTAEQVGWNWFSVQLNDQTELMLYQMRTKGGGVDPNSSGTFVLVDGQPIALSREDYHLSPTASWKSRVTGGLYPIGWKLDIPRLGISLSIVTPVENQELAFDSIAYWEGVIDVQGARGGRPVAGHGYMELTGYSHALEGLRAGGGR